MSRFGGTEVQAQTNRFGSVEYTEAQPIAPPTNYGDPLDGMPEEQRARVEQDLTQENKDDIVAKKHYDFASQRELPPEAVTANIKYEYGENATAAYANEKNAKAMEWLTVREVDPKTGMSIDVPFDPNISSIKPEFDEKRTDSEYKKTFDVLNSFWTRTKATAQISPRMLEDQRELGSKAEEKLGLPKGFTSKLLSLTGSRGGVLVDVGERIADELKERKLDSVSELAYKNIEKASGIQGEYMSGVSIEESIKNKDWETVGEDLGTAIAFELPNLMAQMGLAYASRGTSLLYMGGSSAAQERAEMGESDDVLKNAVKPYIIGGLEVATEKYIGTGRVMDRLAKNQVVNGFWKKVGQIGLDMLGGAASEGGATLGGNITDMAYGEDVNLLDDVLMSAMVGSVMDSGVGVASSAITPMTLGEANRIRKQNPDEGVIKLKDDGHITEMEAEAILAPESEREALLDEAQKAKFEPEETTDQSVEDGDTITTPEGAEVGFEPDEEVDMMAEEIEYPLAPRGEWYGEADYQSKGGKLVEMTPDEFLSKSKPLEMDEETRENVDELKDHMESGRTIDPLNLFEIDLTDVKASDGRHRAIAAKELGYDTVPVVDYSTPAPTIETESKQADAPETIITPENAEQGDIIGISRASNNDFRETFGATELDETAREKQTETMQKAKDDGIIDRADVLARVIDAEPRELKAEEVAGFMMRKAQLANEIESLQEQLTEADEAGNSETVAELNSQLNQITETAETLTRAVTKGAAKNARALAAMAMHMDRKTFSLVNIVAESSKRKGAPLTEEERADAVRLAGEMKVEDDAVARLEAEYEQKLEAEAQARAEEIVAQTLSQRTTVQRRNKAQTKRKEGKEALKKLQWEVNDVTGVPFKVAQALKDIAVSHIMDGATTLDEVVKRVQKDVPDARVTSKVIYDSLGGRVKKEADTALKEGQAVINELKKQAKLQGEIADAMEGVFDPAREKKQSSPEVKKLRAKLKEYRESHLKTETDEAKIDAINERIDKLDDMIERFYRPVKSIKTKSKELKKAEAKLKVKNAELTAQDRIAMLEDLLRSDVQVSEVDASESETSARLETFRAKIAVLERLRRAQVKEAGQEQADAKKAKADEKALNDSISDLTREIETFSRDIRPKRKKADTPKEKKALQIERRRQDQYIELLETIRKQKVSEKVAKTVTEDRYGFEAMKKEAREQMRKEAWYQDQMELRELAQVEIDEAELDRRLAENDFEGFVTPRQERIIKNDDLIKAKIRRNDKRREINRRINDMKPKTWLDHLSTIYEIPRSLKLSFDVGHIGRQAGWSLSNPFRVNPAKYAGESIAAFWNQETADRMELRVLESPSYAQGVQAGLQLPSDIQQVGEVEWIYSGEFMKNKTGWLGKGLAMSERTQVASIKVLRMGLFEGFMERHPETTPAEQKDVAEYINITTGYGMGRTVDGFSKAFEKLMISPRFTASRYQTALMPFVGAVKYRGNKNLQKEVLQDSAWFYGVRASLLMMFGLAFGDKEDFIDVGMNPDHHTFGRIIINLDNGASHVYDPWSGVQRTARIAPALIRGEKDVLAAALGDLAKSAHPTLTGVAHTIAGTKYPSEEIPRPEAFVRMFLPIPFEAAFEGVVAATEGDPITANAIALMFDVVGIGSYTMDTEDLKNKTSWKDRKTNKKK